MNSLSLLMLLGTKSPHKIRHLKYVMGLTFENYLFKPLSEVIFANSLEIVLLSGSWVRGEIVRYN